LTGQALQRRTGGSRSVHPLQPRAAFYAGQINWDDSDSAVGGCRKMTMIAVPEDNSFQAPISARFGVKFNF